MRVLYSFPHPLGGPGIGTTALQQVLGLLRRGHELTVVTTSLHSSCPDLTPAHVITTMTIGGARVPHRLMGQDRTMGYHDARVAGYLKRDRRFDVVHCWPSATLRTARAAQSLGVACVREVPNTHTANAYKVIDELCAELAIELPRGHSHATNAARLAREEQEYAVVTGLLTPSEPVARSFLARGFDSAKLLRHQYGFDPTVFTPRPRAPHGGLRALFLGGVEPRKGLHVALEAWRRALTGTDARLEICGRVVESYRPVIAKELALPNVHYQGFVHDTAGALQSADVLVLPSFEEGSALVTYEAQGCGAVPLVSDAAGAACIDGVSGLVHRAGDVDALTEQFAALNNDRAWLERLRAGVLKTRDSLTWDAAAERLEQCYRAASAALQFA
jgi:glycosyltransferase involved in cell wall biosynthesis